MAKTSKRRVTITLSEEEFDRLERWILHPDESLARFIKHLAFEELYEWYELPEAIEQAEREERRARLGLLPLDADDG